jgi:hypothetical protein
MLNFVYLSHLLVVAGAASASVSDIDDELSDSWSFSEYLSTVQINQKKSKFSSFSTFFFSDLNIRQKNIFETSMKF